MSDTHLFLLVPNDSGSTWLQNIISHCRNCVSFDTGLDGKGACAGTGAYPNQRVNKLFSEQREMWSSPDYYDWRLIKGRWQLAWEQHDCYHTAFPRVYLEKTPQAIYASDMLYEHFDNVRFVISIRNPYAVVEGMRRTIPNEDVSMERCARHWAECAKQQLTNAEKYHEISLLTTYEEIVRNPTGFEMRLRDLVPALNDIDLTKAAHAHSIDGGMGERTLVDYNQKHIDNLSKEDIDDINGVLRSETNVLNYFGYHLQD